MMMMLQGWWCWVKLAYYIRFIIVEYRGTNSSLFYFSSSYLWLLILFMLLSMLCMDWRGFYINPLLLLSKGKKRYNKIYMCSQQFQRGRLLSKVLSFLSTHFVGHVLVKLLCSYHDVVIGSCEVFYSYFQHTYTIWQHFECVGCLQGRW